MEVVVQDTLYFIYLSVTSQERVGEFCIELQEGEIKYEIRKAKDTTRKGQESGRMTGTKEEEKHKK